MYLITKSSPFKNIFLSSISCQLTRQLNSKSDVAIDQREDTLEKKTQQKKYQELDKIKYRPLYLDAQATTPMVNLILFHCISLMDVFLLFLLFSRIHAFSIKCYHI